MADLSLKERRKEIMQWLNTNSLDSLSERDFLETILCLSCDNIDHKKVADNLMKTFQNLENIFSADLCFLLNVDGVNENVAVYISLFRSIKSRIGERKSDTIKNLDNTDSIIQYCRNCLTYLTKERIMLVSLDCNKNVLNKHYMPEGGVNFTNTSPTEIAKIIICEKPKYIVVAHNHPRGTIYPSSRDINFTITLKNWLTQFDVELLDHIIVSPDNGLSLRYDEEYKDMRIWHSWQPRTMLILYL